MVSGSLRLVAQRLVLCRQEAVRFGDTSLSSRLVANSPDVSLRSFLARLNFLLMSWLSRCWQTPQNFRSRCRELYQQDWVVYQEAPPVNLESAALVKYLARYVAGSAIQDRRLVRCENGRVTYHVLNRQTRTHETRDLGVAEFLSRYLLHVLPTGLTRIRYFGFWSANCSAQREKASRLCAASPSTDLKMNHPPALPVSIPASSSNSQATSTCPQCQIGNMSALPSPPFTRWKVRGGLLHVATAETSGKRSWLPTRQRVVSRADPPASSSQ